MSDGSAIERCAEPDCTARRAIVQWAIREPSGVRQHFSEVDRLCSEHRADPDFAHALNATRAFEQEHYEELLYNGGAKLLVAWVDLRGAADETHHHGRLVSQRELIKPLRKMLRDMKHIVQRLNEPHFDPTTYRAPVQMGLFGEESHHG